MTKVNFWVKDYEESKKWFTEKMSWICPTDIKYSETGRWIVVGPEGDRSVLTFSLAQSDEKKEFVGSQVGDHVFCVVETNNIQHFYEKMTQSGVTFHSEIKTEFWGKNVVFEDLYGNLWDLVETFDQKHLSGIVESTEPVLKISLLTLLAKDQDEAKDWYVSKLGFSIISDNTYGSNFRWLELGPESSVPCFTVVQATSDSTKSRIGTQGFLLGVDDLHSFYTHAVANGVEFQGLPTPGYGGVDAQFTDLYGNRWNVRESTV